MEGKGRSKCAGEYPWVGLYKSNPSPLWGLHVFSRQWLPSSCWGRDWPWCSGLWNLASSRLTKLYLAIFFQHKPEIEMDKERKKDGVMEIACIVQASPSAEVCVRAPIIIVIINIFYYLLPLSLSSSKRLCRAFHHLLLRWAGTKTESCCCQTK